MPALRLTTDPRQPDPEVIATAAAALREGKLVAFPTETVYGLGADATDEDAVRRVFAAKQRPAHDPLIVHVHPSWPLDRVVAGEPEEPLRRLAASLWPGPLTIVVPKGAAIAPSVTNGGPLVAVRAPDHPVALALLAAADVPVAAPSANRFSYVSPTSADHVAHDLGDAIDVIVDGGRTTWGIESTVVALRSGRLEVARHGATTVEDLVTAVGDLVEVVDPSVEVEESGAVSPGRAVRHYAPARPTVAVAADVLDGLALGTSARGVLARGATVVGYEDRPPRSLPEGVDFLALGRIDDLSGVAWELYDALRRLDATDDDHLLVLELTGAAGLGRAIDDRLRRAASGRIATSADELAAFAEEA